MARTSSTPKTNRAGAQLTAAQSVAAETEIATPSDDTKSVENGDAPETMVFQQDAFADQAAAEQFVQAGTSAEDESVVASNHDSTQAYADTRVSSSEPETATDTIAAPAEDGSGTARPTGGSDTDAQFITGSSDPVPSTGGPFIPGGVDGDGPTASIGADNLDDLMGQMVDANDVWDKPTVEIDGVETLVLKYAFPDTASEIPFYWQKAEGWTYVDKNGEEVFAPTVGFSLFEAFEADQQDGAMRAMAQWEDMANVKFELAEPGETVDVWFYGVDTEKDWAATSNHQHDTDGSVLSNRIRYNVDKSSWDSMDLGGSGVNTLMHELGHTLGLSHPGSYDAGDGATYDTHAEYIQDTEMYSIMSYFSGENTGANFISVNGDGLPNVTEILDTPRSHDIYTVQQLYGVNWQTRDGDSTYGFNATGVGDVFDFDVNGSPVLTIWDGGGEDWFDLSDSSVGVQIDLNPGAFSSTHGQTYNISIAYAPEDAPSGHEAYIENARGSDNNDVLIGNDVSNILSGNDGGDTLRGEGGGDSLFGGTGADYLFGGSGNDHLFGGDQNDVLSGGHGDDAFYGGTGEDTVDFTFTDADWEIDLGFWHDDPTTGESRGTAVSGTIEEFLQDIENVETGGGDDTITGTNGANEIRAGNGLNYVYGLDGEDILNGGSDADRLYGGDDADVLSGSAGDDHLYGGDDVDSLIGGSGADRLYGGNHNDTLLGGGDVDRLYGGSGVDTLEGHDGGDFLYGGLDGDFLHGGDDNDTLFGGHGADALYGNDHNDWLYGGDDIDSLLGGDGNDNLYGGAASDYLGGGEGSDTLSGGTGDDLLNGGAGHDVASFTYSNDDWTVLLGLGSATSSAGESDELWSIEGVRLGAGDDVVFGDGGENTLEGNGGNDTLYGGGGDDGLYGGSGNDHLVGGVGQNSLIGGSGMDTASYSTAASAVVVDLEVAGYQNTVGAGSDALSQIENLEGSDHDDWLYGDDLGNRLYGGEGADVLSGRSGVNWLYGGDDDDFLISGTDNDLLFGGDGYDTASYYDASGAVYVNLNINGFQNTLGSGQDWLDSIERVRGSQHNDVLIGDDGHNRLTGGDGNDLLSGAGGTDTIYGGDGNDTLIGGQGIDYLDGGDGVDEVSYSSGATAGVTVSLNLGAQNTGGAGIDTLVNIENLRGSHHSDNLYGDGGANVLRGEASSDYLNGGGGNDDLFGGTGGDTIVGAAGNDDIEGGSGNDDIFGGIGNDLLEGGQGFDDFFFANNWGNDRITDFNVAQDDLYFTSVTGLNSAAQLSLTDTEHGVVVGFDGNNVLLDNVSAWQLNDNNLFV